jgi:ferric-dicitrate binding protein FerR (iron transport regulator)
LSYPANFTGKAREVYLTGEAFFDVAHNKERPFMVHTGRFVTKVLGTAFNIRAYDTDPEVRVIVARGKVQVQNETGSQNSTLGVLLPGEQLIVNKVSATASLAKVNVDDALEWKNDDLKFENITLEKAAQIFSRHYEIQIQFKNKTLLNCRFTGDFSNDNLVQALDVICALTNATWKKDGSGVVWIEGKGCQ